MAQIDVRVGQRIRQRRLQFGLSQQDLAANIGISEETLEKVENGEQRAGGQLLSQLAPALGVTIAFFFADD